MSRSRQAGKVAAASIAVDDEPFLMARSLATSYGSGYVLDFHAHRWHQLLYACSGAMTVLAGQASWMIPPGKAVFIPAGCRHSIRMWGTVAMRSLYFPPTLEAPALSSSQCRVVSVTPLLRELILRVVEVSALDSRVPSAQHVMNLLLVELEAAPVTPLLLPLPTDSRALGVAQHLLSNPTVSETTDALAQRHGASRRTVERLFHEQTGISFGMWRQKARMLESIRLLAEGRSVTDAALDSGYNSVSAFIAAFRRTFGCTPRALLSRL
jgi:AraC-like DNA-binding protein/mannose-6-phosphate isomerase-like protein (cupin superfamily)